MYVYTHQQQVAMCLLTSIDELEGSSWVLISLDLFYLLLEGKNLHARDSGDECTNGCTLTQIVCES